MELDGLFLEPGAKPGLRLLRKLEGGPVRAVVEVRGAGVEREELLARRAPEEAACRHLATQSLLSAGVLWTHSVRRPG